MMRFVDLLGHWFTSSVRRQLIWGVALVHAAMMSLFVYDLSVRQREFLIESQLAQASRLAHNLSLIAVTPLLSSDFAGLQELTSAISAYPGVAHAMVFLPSGKIVAHGELQRRGQFVADVPRPGQLSADPLRVLLRGEALADVLVPVQVNNDLLGWVRLGVAQSDTAGKLAGITRSGLLYTVLAIGVGVLLAWWLANQLTRRLHHLARVAGSVSTGEVQLRASIAGSDELSHLARAFNFMLDSLDLQAQRQQSLQLELRAEKELAQVTLASIGDAVISTNHVGHITFLNAAAQHLTQWNALDAVSKPVGDVFQLLDKHTEGPLPCPVHGVLSDGRAVESGDHVLLQARSGKRCPVESLASPIFAPDGQVLGGVLVFRDVSERHLAQDRLQWQAGHDALTGLPNRVLLADRFARALEKARRESTQLAVCMLDLDKFKLINDSYGHATGDALLVALTGRLNQELRALDTLTRLGGDEFVILIEDLGPGVDVQALLARILHVLAAPFDLGEHQVSITASLGYTLYPADDSDPDTLLRHADQAMYVAKQSGRNRHHRFDVLQDRQQESAHQTLERVRQALHSNELLLHYQPKLNMRTGVIAGFEALLRWQHPHDGMIPPLSFLPLIEQSDLIADIGQWVIEQALAQVQQWQAQGHQWPVSVNIAARHFQRADFLTRLQQALAQYPAVAPSLLEFELLESAALAESHATNDLITSCQALGIRFSLDDFGTGYSSLSYLKRLPVQTLKIDQSFVRDMLDDHEDRVLVESIINIARLFKLSVIAEGVETQDQGVLLLRLGCDVVQGYGIARPMPAQAVVAWVGDFVADAHWRRWAEVAWDPGDLPMLMAQREHQIWVDQLMAWLQTPWSAGTTAQPPGPTACRFGIWYAGPGRQRYGFLREYRDIEPQHQRIHALADQLVTLRLAGDLAQAHALVKDLRDSSVQLLGLMEELERAALLSLEMPQLHLSTQAQA